MKIVATADLHGYFPEIEPCDLLLIAGDVCPIKSDSYALRMHEKGAQVRWICSEFAEWCSEQPAENIVWIAGNHDYGPESPGFSRRAERKFPQNCQYLFDKWAMVDGKKVYGMPWTPNLPDWAFYASPRAWEFLSDDIPLDTDILVLHSPPRGAMLDGGHPDWASPFIFEDICNRIQPELCVFGHIHEGYGEFNFRDIAFANVAYCDENYNPVQPPKEYTL
jgi:Icc-related predicted phosphoesterase